MTSGPASILVVDDEEIVRTSCRRILSGADYIIETASDGDAAIGKLEDGPFDLVLTDLSMPDIDGISLLKKVREIYPETEVIIITGYGSVSNAVEALKYGAYDYIEKPFTPEALLNAVDRCLEKKRLLLENLRLKQEISSLYSLQNIIGSSPEMQKVFRMMATVAPTGSTVLINGESGTGKEIVARAIHYNSTRKDRPFVVVDCGSIPENLVESELFGHVKGSYTGAMSTEAGLLEAADGGTLFLDEVSNLPPAAQMKLLRVLQEREFRPVGGKNSVRLDLRVISATNRELRMMAKEGSFREDLYYRLNVFPINLPPLRDRMDDIPALAYHFLSRYSEEIGRDLPHISAHAMKCLIAHDWPGNVRELENVIHRAVIVCPSRVLKPEHIIIPRTGLADTPKSLEDLKKQKKALRDKSVEDIEKGFLTAALGRNNWNITKAARDVGMQRTNFHALMKKYLISRDAG